MLVDVDSTLKKALGQLRSQRERLNHQINALEMALDGSTAGPGMPPPSRPRRRRRMSAAARRALGQRMKAYWAKRKAARQNTQATEKAAKRK